jgi:hypothetical protein
MLKGHVDQVKVFLLYLTVEKEGLPFIRNVGNNLPYDTASVPRRQNCSEKFGVEYFCKEC